MATCPRTALRCASALTGIRRSDFISVASFYHQFRLRPAGRHVVRICHGTACHVKGAENIQDAVHRHLQIPAGSDTDAAGEFTVERVACLGCCTLAPVVQAGPTTYGHLAADTVPALFDDFRSAKADARADVDTLAASERPGTAEIRVGLGSCCMAKGSDALFHRLRDEVARAGSTVAVKRVGCVGMCHQHAPSSRCACPRARPRIYAEGRPDEAESIVRRHFRPAGLGRRVAGWLDRTLDRPGHAGARAAQVARTNWTVRDGPWRRFWAGRSASPPRASASSTRWTSTSTWPHGGFLALRQVLSRGSLRTVVALIASQRAARARRRGLPDRPEVGAGGEVARRAQS
jgi:NADH:ubiquinone oxidoreductase subunit E